MCQLVRMCVCVYVYVCACTKTYVEHDESAFAVFICMNGIRTEHSEVDNE